MGACAQPLGGQFPAVVEQEYRPSVAKTVDGVGLAAGAGTIAEYLPDPDRGRSRRAKVYDKVGAACGPNGGRPSPARTGPRRTRPPCRPPGRGRRPRAGCVGDAQRGRDRRRGTARPAGGEPCARRQARRGPLARTRDPTGIPQLQGAARPREPVPEPLQQQSSPAVQFMPGSGALAMGVVTSLLPRPLAWALRGIGSAMAVRATTNVSFKRLTGITASPDVRDVRRSADGRSLTGTSPAGRAPGAFRCDGDGPGGRPPDRLEDHGGIAHRPRGPDPPRPA